MKYTCKLVINLPRERMVKLFDDPDNMLKWMEGLQRFEHVSGTAGKPGAQSRLVFARDDGETFDMIETLTSYNLPDEISGTYETEGVRNVIENWFVEDGPNATRWIARNEFQVQRLHAHRGVVHVAAVQAPVAQDHGIVQGLRGEHGPGRRRTRRTATSRPLRSRANPSAARSVGQRIRISICRNYALRIGCVPNAPRSNASDAAS